MMMALAIKAEDPVAPAKIPTALAIKAEDREDRMAQAETNRTGLEIKAADRVDPMAPVKVVAVEEAILRTAKEIHPTARAVRLAVDTAAPAEVLPIAHTAVDRSKAAAKAVVNPMTIPPEAKVITPTVVAIILALPAMAIPEAVVPTTHTAVDSRVVRVAREVMEAVGNRDTGVVDSKVASKVDMVDKEATTPTTKYSSLSCVSIF
jgi:hypothetical protein